jgi:hypothetical protein
LHPLESAAFSRRTGGADIQQAALTDFIPVTGSRSRCGSRDQYPAFRERK